jgi:NifU-like protein
MVKLTLRVEGGVILDARAKTFGCAAAIASSSALTELLKGRTVQDARRIRNADVVAFLGGLPEHKVICSVVAEEAVREALRQEPSA